jgi:hypothetical protein
MLNKNIKLILGKCNKYGVGLSQAAYVLATVQYEAGGTYEPIDEYGDDAYFTEMYEGRADLGNTVKGDSIKYHGRGFVQLTGRRNYTEYAKITGRDLVNHPELAKEPDIAAEILVHGMVNGVFTGLKLGNFIAGSTVDYVGARKIINGTDRAYMIADYADVWRNDLIEKSELSTLLTGSTTTVPASSTGTKSSIGDVQPGIIRVGGLAVQGVGAGLSQGIAVDMAKVLRQYCRDGKQDEALNYLHFVISTLDNSIIWNFARKYRNNEDGSDIDFVAVAEWYEAQTHQVVALDYLHEACQELLPGHLELFYELWAAITLPLLSCQKPTSEVQSTSDDGYKHLYTQMTHNGERIPAKGSTEESNIRKMVLELQRLEKHLGVQISLTSGYRPEPINSEVGGVPGSMHTTGLAADCYSNQMDDSEFESKASKYWLDNKLGGVGMGMKARKFTHVDLGEVREWMY